MIARRLDKPAAIEETATQLVRRASPSGGIIMKSAAFISLVIAAAPTLAQTPPPPPSQILVSASGTARTPPDMVTVGFTLRGEGTTSDEAAAKLRDAAKAMTAGVNGLLHDAGDYRTANLGITQVRSRDCDANNYGQQRLSTGPCAIIGYIALLPVSIDTPRVKDAGTLISVIGRLGGQDAAVQRFWLRDETAARTRATQAALTDAHDQAALIAAGAGGKLGPLMRVQDADYREISLDMAAAPRSVDPLGAPPPPPPPPPQAPVRIDLAPDTIRTTVRLMAAYGIDR